MYEDLVKELRQKHRAYVLTDNAKPGQLFADAADAIEELNAYCDNMSEAFAALEAIAPHWIPVSERLPEKALKSYPKWPYSLWMLTVSGKEKRIEFGAYNVEEKEWHDDFGEVMTGVTHWMPLPEPPKDGE